MNCSDLCVSANNLNAFRTSSTATAVAFLRVAESELGAIRLSAYRSEAVAPIVVNESRASSSKVTSSSTALHQDGKVRF